MSDSKETILLRMLNDIDDQYDKSEGGFIFDAEMPVAIELEKSYLEQEKILPRAFAETATGEDLDKIAAEQGLIRKPATFSTTIVTITGTVGSSINIGDKVSSEEVSFLFMENKTIGVSGIETVNAQCELSGSIGNVPSGTIKYFPVTLVGLSSVTNNETVSNGYNSESDEELRIRYYSKVQTPSTSGNKYHYINWSKEVIGVGDAKVFPLWNGNGTVKVVLIDSNKRAANQTLINTVTDYIEENRPIGANVTIQSASEKLINISATIILSNGISLNTANEIFEGMLIDYLKSIAFAQSYVAYSKIGSLLLSINGVLDYSNLLINGSSVNVTINDTEIAVLGTLSLGV